MAEQKIEPKVRHFIRICATDLEGKLPLHKSLQKIPGVGHNFAHALCHAIGFDLNLITGNLSEEQIKLVQDTVENPNGKLPNFMFNRKKDLITGEDSHLSSSKLRLVKDADIKRLRRLKTYRGMRHSYGQPVRGQRTRSNFRKGRAVGVMKKSDKSKKG